jgi:hypothetical protein
MSMSVDRRRAIFTGPHMTMFEFSEIEVKRILGPEWTHGAVRVHSDVIAVCRGAPVDALEIVLRRHMNLDVGELQCDSCVHDAISTARDSAQNFVTRYFLFRLRIQRSIEPGAQNN